MRSPRRSVRFLMLVPRFPPEVGAQPTRLAATALGLQRAGHEVEVVAPLPNHPEGRIFSGYRNRVYTREEWEDITIHRVWLYPATGAGLRRILCYASYAATSLMGLIRARKPDYLFVDSPPLFLSLPAWLAAVRWKVPFIFNVADLWPDSVRELDVVESGVLLRFAERLEAWTYRKASFITAVTEGIKETLQNEKGVPTSKLLFLPNGIDTQVFRPTAYDAALAKELKVENKWVVLYAGNHGYAQGLDVVLHAAQLLSDSCVHFLLVGDGPEKNRLVQQANDRKLQNVSFLDSVRPEQVTKLYGLAQAGLTSLLDRSLFDGARPVKTLTTMAAGKPVLYSGRGEGAQLVEDARAGVVVPPEDPEALAQAVMYLKDQPQQAERMGRDGRQFVEAHYSWEVLIERWLDQLKSKAAGDPSAQARG